MSITTTNETSRSWKKHQADFLGCRKCPLHCNTFSYILGRGSLPCDILFIAEAPSREDDDVGRLLAGAYGRLFDRLIKESQEALCNAYTFAVTSLVACSPLTPLGVSSVEAYACKDRLEDFIILANPSGIVFLGLKAQSLCNSQELIEINSEAIYPLSLIQKLGGYGSIAYEQTLNSLVTFVKDNT